MQGSNCLLSEQVCRVMGGLLFCNVIRKSLGDSCTDSGSDTILCRVVNWDCYLKKILLALGRGSGLALHIHRV